LKEKEKTNHTCTQNKRLKIPREKKIRLGC